MTVAAPVKPEQRNKLLRAVCARNIPAELHLETAEAGVITTRVRLLHVDALHVYVDEPHTPAGPLPVRPRQPVVTHFLFSGTRYAFRSKVIRRCQLRLNEHKSVTAVAIGVPGDVRIEQRRADFRLSLAGYDIPVEGHPGRPDHGGHCALMVFPFAGRLTNISAGGMGLVVDEAIAAEWQIGQVFFFVFRLPGATRDLWVMSTLRHLRGVPESLSTVAGLQFLPWPLVPMRTYVREINRFIAGEQRRRLRRGR